MKKWIVWLLMVAMLCCAVCACAPAEKDITWDEAVGKWSGTYTYKGNSYSVTFDLDDSGIYYRVTYKNGNLHDYEYGTWKIEDGDVALYDSEGLPGTAIYNYVGGALVNGGHEFRKE